MLDSPFQRLITLIQRISYFEMKLLTICPRDMNSSQTGSASKKQKRCPKISSSHYAARTLDECHSPTAIKMLDLSIEITVKR